MNRIEFAAKLVGIFAGIIAVVVFINDVADDQNARHANRIDLWRKAAIQKILQQADSNILDIDELLVQMKNLAWDDDGLDISKDDLTEDEIRVLLIEMISMEILYQKRDDNYELRFITKTTSEADVTISEIIDKGQKFQEALVKLGDNPNFYNRESFYNNVVEPIGINRFDYDLAIDLLIRQKKITLNQEGQMTMKKLEMEDVDSPKGADQR